MSLRLCFLPLWIDVLFNYKCVSCIHFRYIFQRYRWYLDLFWGSMMTATIVASMTIVIHMTIITWIMLRRQPSIWVQIAKGRRAKKVAEKDEGLDVTAITQSFLSTFEYQKLTSRVREERLAITPTWKLNAKWVNDTAQCSILLTVVRIRISKLNGC